MGNPHEEAILGAGCFWGIEEILRDIRGVIDTEVGYTGGRTEDPTYHDVTRGDTGHAEAIRVVFDPGGFKHQAFSITWATFVLSFWAGPALIGTWTQIRRGLPEFAHAPRTIVAAANLEAHRLTFLAIASGLVFSLDTLMRVSMQLPMYRVWVSWMWTVPLFFGLVGWIGPLRSDYTRQLIRSRWHLARIIIMYAILFPIIAFAICSMVLTLLSDLDISI